MQFESKLSEKPTKAGHGRGWRRIGVILSVLWFVGFGFFVWSYEVRQNATWYSSTLSLCYAMSNDTDRKTCLADVSKVFSDQFDQNVRALPLLIGADLAVIAVGWLLVWCVVLLARWVLKGFVSA